MSSHIIESNDIQFRFQCEMLHKSKVGKHAVGVESVMYDYLERVLAVNGVAVFHGLYRGVIATCTRLVSYAFARLIV